jgi:hypothetical protein
MEPAPPKNKRPMTSRTRKKVEQMEADEDIAKVLALEEDEKIAEKSI